VTIGSRVHINWIDNASGMHMRSSVYACMHAKWSFQKTNVSADAKIEPLALSSIVYRN
jgi:hypothetical protein